MKPTIQGWVGNLKHSISVLSTRDRLFIFAIIVMIPMIIFGSLAIRQNTTHAKRQVLESSLATARILETNLAGMFADTEGTLFTLSNSSVIRSQDARLVHQLLINVFPSQPSLLNLAVSRRDGSLLASVVWGGLDKPTVGNDPLFHRALTSGQLEVSGRVISRSTDKPAVRLFLPYKDDKGAIIGTLIADVSLSRLQSSLSSISVEEGATFIVTDAHGMVLVHPDYTYVAKRTDLSTMPAVRAALDGNQGTLEDKDPSDGRQWLWAFTPVRNTGWAVVVGYPTEIAFPSVTDTLWRGTGLLLAMIGIALFLAIVISRQMANPVRELTQTALAIAGGDLDQKVEVGGSHELRQLARAFNLMAENLKLHLGELAEAKEEISRKAKRLQVLLAHTISLQEEERQRIAGDLHDSISQLLLGALYEAEAIKTTLPGETSQAVQGLNRVQGFIEQTTTEIRRVIYNLRPPLLDDIGFIPAVGAYAKAFSQRTGIDIAFDVTGRIERLPEDSELALYRISQEALNNIRKHARTDRADIHIDFTDHRMQMTICDYGVGFDPSSLSKTGFEHMGLPGMEERASSIGANLEVLSGPGDGTTVQVVLGTGKRKNDP